MKKFELTTESITFLGRTLFRIKALIPFGDVEAGELGGYIEKEENLSNEGDAGVYDNARGCDNARVYGNAWVYGNARVCDNAEVYGDAEVCGNADIATISGFGSEYRTTTFFRTKNNEIAVKCGCFYGTLAGFREKVKETHGDNRYAKEYLMIADLMEMHFRGEEE